MIIQKHVDAYASVRSAVSSLRQLAGSVDPEILGDLLTRTEEVALGLRGGLYAAMTSEASGDPRYLEAGPWSQSHLGTWREWAMDHNSILMEVYRSPAGDYWYWVVYRIEGDGEVYEDGEVQTQELAKNAADAAWGRYLVEITDPERGA